MANKVRERLGQVTEVGVFLQPDVQIGNDLSPRHAGTYREGRVRSGSAVAGLHHRSTEEEPREQQDTMFLAEEVPPVPSRLARFLSALAYGVCSFLIVLVNKVVLTSYSFPSSTCLGIGQMGVTIMILYIGKLNQIINFPDFDRKTPKKLFPLPLLYIGNHLTGLASTKKLSLPMFTVLRKFCIPMTMVLEYIILRKRHSFSVICTVIAIVAGAIVAASHDLSFNLEGYVVILLNDFFTASNGVYTKEKIDPKELGQYGVLYYNACFMLIPTIMFSYVTGDLHTAIMFSEWTNIAFAAQFLLSCVMGFLLLYTIVLCSHYNSALTTTVVGAVKNSCIAYIGIFIGGDYQFSWLNFLGLNICLAGGLFYSFIVLQSKAPSSAKHQSQDHIKLPPTVNV